MKKTFFAALAAIAMSAGLASCSSDEPMNGTQNGQEVTVTVTATLPTDMQSRVYSDGEKALDMWYAVYEEGVASPIIALNKSDKQFSGLTNTLTLHLVTGKNYNIVFWAQAPEAETEGYFTLDTQESTVTVNYDKIKNLNVEKSDAFFCYKAVEVKGSASITAELRRPFAQINVGTNDINEAGLKDKKISTKMTVSSVYSAFDLKDGKVIGTTTTAPIEFAETPRPNQGKETTATDYEKFPVGNLGDYEYLAMAYVLMAPDKITTDVELEFYDDGTCFHELSVPGAPVQRNYRTNIFGALLTSSIDFTITIKPEYDGVYDEDQAPTPWDGKSVSIPTKVDYDASGEVTAVYISSPEELLLVKGAMLNGYELSDRTGLDVKASANAAFTELDNMINSLGEDYMQNQGLTLEEAQIAIQTDYPDEFNAYMAYLYLKYGQSVALKLDADIDLNGNSIPDLNCSNERNTNYGGWNFDGQGHTISNLVRGTQSMFGTGYGTVKNVTFKNVTGCNILFTEYRGSEITNVHVDGATMDSGNGGGMLIGTIANNNTTISGCTVKNVTIDYQYSYFGGLVGNVKQSTEHLGKTTFTIENCAISNITITDNVDGKGYIMPLVGSTNTANGLTLNYTGNTYNGEATNN